MLKKLALILALFICHLGLAQEEDGVPQPSLSEQYAERIAKAYDRPVAEIQTILDVVQANTSKDTFPAPLDVLAVVAVESRFKNAAKGLPGPCVGLMQVNASVHRGLKLRDPGINIKTGVDLLRSYRDLMQSEDATYVAYSHGPRKAKSICGSKSTCNNEYVKKIKRQRTLLAFLMEQPVQPVKE